MGLHSMRDCHRKQPSIPKTYSSSLTDQEWAIVEPILLDALPKKSSRRPLEWSYHELPDGMLYHFKNECTIEEVVSQLLLYCKYAKQYQKATYD